MLIYGQISKASPGLFHFINVVISTSSSILGRHISLLFCSFKHCIRNYGNLSQQLSHPQTIIFNFSFTQIEAIQHSDDFDPGSQKEENFAFDYFFEKTMAEQRKSEERKEDGKEEEESEDGAAQFMSRKTRKQRLADNS